MTTAELLQVVVGALVSGDILATLAMKKRLDAVAQNVAKSMELHAAHTTAMAVQEGRLALGNQAFAQMREDLLELRARVAKLEGP